MESRKRALRIHKLEEKLKRRKEELGEAQAELVGLRANKEELIDNYLVSPDFWVLMDKHYDILFPTQFIEGWNGALEVVLKKHHGLFLLSELSTPYPPAVPTIEPALSEDRQRKDQRVLGSDASPPQKAAVSDSTTATSPSPPKKIMAANSTSSSSSEEEDELDDTSSKEVYVVYLCFLALRGSCFCIYV